MDNIKGRKLRLGTTKYVLIGYYLFRKSPEGILLRCANDKYANKTLKSFHGSFEQLDHVGGHFAAREIIYKIFRINYY